MMAPVRFVTQAFRASATVRNSVYFFAATCAMYAFLALMVASEDQTIGELIADGRVTTGTVTGTDCGNHGSIHRTFTPSASDPRLSEYGAMPQPPNCDLVRPGQRIVLVYLPANPALNRIGDPRDQLASNVDFLGTAVLFMPGFGLSWVALALYLYASGHPRYRDPVVPTIGHAPEGDAMPLQAGASRVTSRTQELPMSPEIRLVLTTETAELDASTLRVLAILVAALTAVGLGGAMGAHNWLPFIAFGGGAAALGLVGSLVRGVVSKRERRDMAANTIVRTSGAARLTWTDTRGGRLWTLRVGDRELSSIDDTIGLQLGNMPWGEVDYTKQGRKLLAVRDADGRTVYRRQATPRPKHPALFAVALLVVVLVLLGLAIGSAFVMGSAVG